MYDLEYAGNDGQDTICNNWKGKSTKFLAELECSEWKPAKIYRSRVCTILRTLLDVRILAFLPVGVAIGAMPGSMPGSLEMF